jgi:hypothetical protein
MHAEFVSVIITSFYEIDGERLWVLVVDIGDGRETYR